MSPLPMFLLVALPVWPALTAWVLGSLERSAARALMNFATGVTLGLALLTAAMVAAAPGPSVWSMGAVGAPWSFQLRLDAVMAAMVLLVAFLGWAIGRFATRAMAGEQGEVNFYRGLQVTVSAVFALVVAGNLLVLFLAWVGTSMALHVLLRHYRERRAARMAARKKFVISRLGDGCLIAAGWLIWRRYGTWEFDSLFEAVAANPTAIAGPALLLACGAAIKSAQIPFHWWLPETMETPTPVSALMHAGIINAGGFLVIRLSPLFAHAPGALTFLAIIGGFTAAFGAVVMLTQPSVKRALAYSTIAQMGFMLLECGLGAFGLAFLHLVAHSLYKAHAFLTSGSTVGGPPRTAILLHGRALAAGVTIALAIMVALHPWWERADGVNAVFAVGLGLALAYGLARLWSANSRARDVALGTVAATAFAVLAVFLHRAADFAIPSGPAPAVGVIVFAMGVFVALFFSQLLVARSQRYAWSRALYVHALNGFYLGTYAQRFFIRWERRINAIS